MKINSEELYKLYMDWVNQVSEDCDWKTSFGPQEIVYAIARIIENNPNLITQTMKQTAVEWLYNISKQRELDKFDLEEAKKMEEEQTIKGGESKTFEITDEEIERFAMAFHNINAAEEFVRIGARWYREKLRTK